MFQQTMFDCQVVQNNFWTALGFPSDLVDSWPNTTMVLRPGFMQFEHIFDSLTRCLYIYIYILQECVYHVFGLGLAEADLKQPDHLSSELQLTWTPTVRCGIF